MYNVKNHYAPERAELVRSIRICGNIGKTELTGIILVSIGISMRCKDTSLGVRQFSATISSVETLQFANT